MEDLSLILALLAGVTSTVIGSLAAWITVRMRSRLDARSRAGLVFVHFEETPTGQSSWVIENRSDSEIYDIQLEVSESRISFQSLSPGVQRVTLDRILIQDAESVDPVLTFKDKEGNQWKANNSGFEEESEPTSHTIEFSSFTSQSIFTLLATLLGAISIAVAIVISVRMR